MLRVDSGFNETSRHHLSRSLRRGDGYFNISAAAGNPSRLLKTVTAIQIWVADKLVSTVKENLEESWNLQMSLSWAGKVVEFAKSRAEFVCRFTLALATHVLIQKHQQNKTCVCFFFFFAYVLSHYCTIR